MMAVKVLELYVPLPVTLTALDVNTGTPVQLGLPGPNRVKVIEPAGLNPPARVALSDTVPPAGTDADGVVVIVGIAGVVVTDSLAAPQALVAPALAVSPL